MWGRGGHSSWLHNPRKQSRSDLVTTNQSIQKIHPRPWESGPSAIDYLTSLPLFSLNPTSSSIPFIFSVYLYISSLIPQKDSMQPACADPCAHTTIPFDRAKSPCDGLQGRWEDSGNLHPSCLPLAMWPTLAVGFLSYNKLEDTFLCFLLFLK